MSKDTLELIGVLLSVLLFFLLFFYCLFEIKLDYTIDGKLLLWYTHYETNGDAERRYLILYQKPTK